MTSYAERPGAVVLAAYRPDPDLFAVQLRSIRDQTLGTFRCLVGADGGQEEVRALVDAVVGDDPRFEVVGWDDNVGFHLNVERLLLALPREAAWVALADQDDRWYPDKLARLVPLLDDVPLATGQARVVRWPGGEVLLPTTRRRVVPLEDLLVENQVTGSLAVLRRELVDLALPFPRLHTVTQMHDHWLGLAGAVGGGYRVLDEAVQDYVQHGGNVVGEVATHRSWTPARVVRRVVDLADTYEGGHSPAACSRVAGTLGFGWRRLLVETLTERCGGVPPGLEDAAARLRRDGSGRAAVAFLGRALRSPEVSPWVVATFVPGLPHELLARRRARRQRRGAPA